MAIYYYANGGCINIFVSTHRDLVYIRGESDSRKYHYCGNVSIEESPYLKESTVSEDTYRASKITITSPEKHIISTILETLGISRTPPRISELSYLKEEDGLDVALKLQLDDIIHTTIKVSVLSAKFASRASTAKISKSR